MKKLILTCICIVLTFLGVSRSRAEENYPVYYHQTAEGLITNNKSANNYSTRNDVVNSYLYREGNEFVRVEYDGSVINVERYDKDYVLLSSRTVDMELPLFGGFFSGTQYNYIVYGQNNPDESAEQEVIRVVRYSKNWEQLGTVSYYGINTKNPFNAGSCSFTELNGYLHIRTCHTMFKNASDGLNHQANIIIIIDEASFTSVDIRYTVWNTSTGYVSHSFNQLLTTDGEYVYTADHGDAYPRSIFVTKLRANSTSLVSSASIYEIPGTIGANATGVSVGDIAVSADNLLVAINSVDCSDADNYSASGPLAIKLLVTDKNYSVVREISFTEYSSENIYKTPSLTRINNDKFLMMWEVAGNDGNYVSMVLVDGNGNKISKIIRVGASLSDCHPVVTDDKAIWYVTNSRNITFYEIDCSDKAVFESYDGAELFTDEVADNILTDYNWNWAAGTYDQYSYGSDALMITKYVGQGEKTDLSALDKYHNLKVVFKYGVYQNCDNLREVTLPDNAELNVSGMFSDCTNLQKVTGGTYTTLGAGMFSDCWSLESFDIPEAVVEIGSQAFYRCRSLKNMVIPENVQKIGSGLFYGCSGLESVIFKGNRVSVPNASQLFLECSSLKSVDLSNLDFSETDNMQEMFYECTSLSSVNFGSPDLSNVKLMNFMFAYCENLQELDISSFVTPSLTEMYSMFSMCRNLKKLDISGLNTAAVTNMGNLFEGCNSLCEVSLGTGFTTWEKNGRLPAGDWQHGDILLPSDDLAEQYPANADKWAGKWQRIISYAVETSDGDFVFFNADEVYNCNEDIQTVRDISGNSHTGRLYDNFLSFRSWRGNDTVKRVYVAQGSTVRPYSMDGWFRDFTNVEQIDLKGIDSRRVTDMSMLFYGCQNLKNISFGNMSTSEVTSMDYMFYNCSKIEKLSLTGFDTAKVTDMSYMFYNCSSLKTIYVRNNFVTDNVTSDSYMFYGSSKLVGENGTVYDSSHVDKEYARIDGSNGPGYFTEKPYDDIWTWSGFGAASVTLYDDNGKKVTTLKATISSEEFEATCEEGSKTVYTALATYQGKKYIDVRSEYHGDPLGHEWVLNYWIWFTDYHGAYASFVCWRTYGTADSHSKSIYANSVIDKISGSCPDGVTVTYKVTVELDGTEYSDSEDVQKEPGEHRYQYQGITWRNNNTAYASFLCDTCHDAHNVECTVTKTGHEATCDQDSTLVYEAEAEFEGTVYSDRREIKGKALGHNYKLDHWTWNSDHSRATATLVCSRDAAHILEKEASVTTVSKNGRKLITASVTVDGNEYSTQVILPKGNVIRLYGDNRYETSLKAAYQLKEILGTDKFDSIVLATGKEYPDALSGSYVANKFDAPLLLVRENSKKTAYADIVQNFVRENVRVSGTIYVLGGETAFPQEWLGDLDEQYEVIRLDGKNRYYTNLSILDEVGCTGGEILVCTGKDYADSLSASGVELPILLVDTKLKSYQKTFLEGLSDPVFHIVGGTGAVSSDVEEALRQYGKVDRIAGDNRYHTSVLIAERFFDDAQSAVLTYGRNFPDGLSGGTLAHALNCPLILTNSSRTNSTYASNYCTDLIINEGIVLGGPTLITDEYVRKIFSMEPTDTIN